MGSFVEKIAQVKIKGNREDFAHFYGITKFPISFNLEVSVTFLKTSNIAFCPHAE